MFMLKKNIHNFIISVNIAQRSSRILLVNINMDANTVCQTMYVKTARSDFSLKRIYKYIHVFIQGKENFHVQTSPISIIQELL